MLRQAWALLALLVFSIPAAAQVLGPALQPDQRAEPSRSRILYFGIAGPAAGLGQWGHAFLLFAPKPKVFLSGLAYQFNNLVDEELAREGVAKVAQRVVQGKLPSIFSREDGAAFLHRYTAEDRVVTLYPLRMTEAEVQAVQKLLEDEYHERRSNNAHDYDVIRRNCLTKLIDPINAVLGKGRSFPDPKGAFMPANIFSPDAWTVNIPISFEITLQGSGLVDPAGIYRSMPVSVDRAKALMKLLPVYSEIERGCRWPEDKSRVIRSFLVNTRIRYTEKFQNYLALQLYRCTTADPKAMQLFVDLISYDLQYFSDLPEETLEVLQRRLSGIVRG